MRAAAGRLWLLAVLLATASVDAGTISIGIAHRLEITSDRIIAIITVSNSGDEAAHSVRTVLEILGAEYCGESRATLEPGASHDERLEVSTEEAEGRWPYRVAVDYSDANQYPFQALSVATFERGVPPPPQIAVTSITAPALAQSGSVTVDLKNLTDSELGAIVRLMLPRGLESPSAGLDVKLAPWEQRSVEIPLANRFALEGSRYPLFAVVESDDQGQHQSVVASTDLEIVDAVTVEESSRSYLWTAAGTLGVLFLVLLVWKVATRRGAM